MRQNHSTVKDHSFVDKYFTVQTVSSLTNLDHNPPHVLLMYITAQNHVPDNIY